VSFRTATLKTLTAFNFRWPSILFSLVWTTLPRTEAPFALRHAPHAFAKEITCPLPPSYRFRPLLSCPFAPFLFFVSVCSRSHRVLARTFVFEARDSLSYSRVAPNKNLTRKSQPRRSRFVSRIARNGKWQAFSKIILNDNISTASESFAGAT
jgi:hypothetical protein